jgi:hypothetical protein
MSGTAKPARKTQRNWEERLLDVVSIAAIVVLFIAACYVLDVGNLPSDSASLDSSARVNEETEKTTQTYEEWGIEYTKVFNEHLEKIDLNAQEGQIDCAKQVFQDIIKRWRFSCLALAALLDPLCAQWNDILAHSDADNWRDKVIALRNSTVPTDKFYQRDEKSYRVLMAMTPISTKERNTNHTCTIATLRAVAAECV